ncbi:enolase C-terminal domain-like protein, partial [Liquorilactobacillus satsumensis]|uniref:enolase C-terminal domain-like protein n=1 Tax=Liquorilactobacillus satsumensis TaxID=259059 RepID=UPI0039ED59D2
MAITIKNIKIINTAPEGINLQVIKIETSEDGLYGLGCSTFAYRYKVVEMLIEKYIKPLIIGLDVSDIQQIWNLMFFNSYWRGGPISNCAIAGIDMALWDIKGKIANLPLYSMLGGKVRNGVPVYRHADGNNIEELFENIEKYSSLGVKTIRCQLNGYGGKYGSPLNMSPSNSPKGVYLDSKDYIRKTLNMFDKVRSKFGNTISLVHDVHERLEPQEAVIFAKELEKYNLTFLEDAIPLEQLDWFKRLRNQSSIPLAEGELFNGEKDWKYLISNHLIDFLRVHISQIGGITPAIKLKNFAEIYGVKIAWHGPGDLSPVGHAVNIHIDLCSNNLGIQEWSGIEPPNSIIQNLSGPRGALLNVFHGLPNYKNGYVYLNNKPGIGVD